MQLAKQLIDEQRSVQQQINAQSWLVGCYFEQTKKTKDATIAGELFEQAIECSKEVLPLAEKLADHPVFGNRLMYDLGFGRFLF